MHTKNSRPSHYPRYPLLVWVLGLFCLLSTYANAATIVLIHGYQGQGMDWRLQGVTPAMQSVGWQDGGHLKVSEQGIYPWFTQNAAADRVFFTIDLPSHAPIAYQAEVLDQHLQYIQTIRREPLTLVGHSAGGLVARYWLVTQHSSGRSDMPVNALMTIATPNLGTALANAATVLHKTPLADMADKMGFAALGDAKHLARDLRQEKPGNFLYWLNHQPHPVYVRYVSVIRDSDRPDQRDFAVPAYSQDMNYVFALRGKAFPVRTHDDHFLSLRDGYRIASVASALPSTSP